MTSNTYIIDTSSLIRLNRENPIDVYPSVWEKLEYLCDRTRLVAPEEVFKEISVNDDQLSKWVKDQDKLFKKPTLSQINIVKKILEEYPSLVKPEQRFGADPWVIALAVEMMKDPQGTLVPIKRIVVSEEQLRGDRVRIPLVCGKWSVEAIEVITMFRTEGWKF